MNNIKYYDTSYQDFYEDKLLLIEYDLTPDEILEMKLGCYNQITINGQTYNFLNFFFTTNHKLHQIVISFSSSSLESLSESPELDEVLSKLPCNWEFKPISTIINSPNKLFGNGKIDIIYYLAYTNPILLSWEEITDKLYLNFIIKSTSEYLKKYLQHNFKNNNIIIKIDHINIYAS